MNNEYNVNHFHIIKTHCPLTRYWLLSAFTGEPERSSGCILLTLGLTSCLLGSVVSTVSTNGSKKRASSSATSREDGLEDEEAQSTSHVPFYAGETFLSYEDLYSKITMYEKNNCVKLWKRDSRSVEAACKQLNRASSNKIKYYEVTLCCIHGGKKLQAKGGGIRVTK